jgi:hypothetical protein
VILVNFLGLLLEKKVEPYLLEVGIKVFSEAVIGCQKYCPGQLGGGCVGRGPKAAQELSNVVHYSVHPLCCFSPFVNILYIFHRSKNKHMSSLGKIEVYRDRKRNHHFFHFKALHIVSCFIVFVYKFSNFKMCS